MHRGKKLSFFKFLADSKNPTAILRVLPICSENFIPHTLTYPDVPLILTEILTKNIQNWIMANSWLKVKFFKWDDKYH